MAGDATSFVLVITSLILWGSWANTYKIAELLYGHLKEAEFELFFIGFSIAACYCCYLPVDAIGDSFWVEQRWTQHPFRMSLVAGSVANIGKVCITGAIEMTGMTVAIPLVMGIEIFLGTILLFVTDPDDTNPYYLFSGVFLVLMAVMFDILFQLQMKEPHEKNKALLHEPSDSFGAVEISGGGEVPTLRHQRSDSSVMRGYAGSDNGRHSSSKQGGILLAIISGLCLAIWPVIYEMEKKHITWEEFYFGFALSLGLTSIITLPFFGWLRGTDFTKLQWFVLLLGILGGLMMCSSYYLMFASQEGLHLIVSMTIVRCSPVIGAFWGIVLWEELKGASDLAITYVVLMFILYIAALVLIALSVLTMEEDNPAAPLADKLLT